MAKARKYVVKNQFQGIPNRSDYEIVEYELPPLQDGEFLVKTEWIGVEPYNIYLKATVPYDQLGFQVGIVEKSRNPDYPIGSRVVSHNGWCDYSILKDTQFGVQPTDTILGWLQGLYKIPDLKGLPPYHAIGSVGMQGASAYIGFLDICKPKSGETVVVTAAAGAIGSIVGQIAKLKGCRVIGFTGSDEKVDWLEKELGFNKAYNYKRVDITEAVKEAAPNGVDCFFDNVGGEMANSIISQMNNYGRISLCGAISTYFADKIPKVTDPLVAVVTKQLKLETFIISDFIDRWPQAFSDIVNWIKNGDLKEKVHVTEGFDKTFDAFVDMIKGGNIGKAIVKV